MITKGISDHTAIEILKKSGYNELPSSKPKSFWRVAKEVISEPMFMLLLGCGFLYMVLGDYKEGIVMIATIFILVGISFYQNFRTEKALAALRSLASPRVLVYRDGVVKRIPGREVVPGDLMLLNEGDRIAADGELTESVNLEIDESMLSGESVTVRKQIGKDIQVYSGTLIVKGKGTALVMATGLQAKLGKIATSLSETDGGGTRLQKEMTVLVRRLGIAGAVICVGIVGIYYAVRGNFIQSLLNGLAAAMAIIPEEFPVVFTIFLALGAWRLSKVNVLTRKPSAIENLGAATVLCSDKTGTITQNKMMVVMLYNGASTIEIDASKSSPVDFKSLVEYAYVASQHDSIDPMEKAIQVLHTASHDGIYPVHPLLKEYELSDSLLAMTRWVNNDENGGLMGATKGAPEAIFQLCGMSDAEAAIHLEAVKKMAEAGCRVIGVARPSWDGASLPEKQAEFKFTFLGLLGLEDPLRPEVTAAVEECNSAGIRVIMITGDYPATAKSIGARIGLPAKSVLTGSEMEAMDDSTLGAAIKETHIFARIIPEQKLRLVNILKANGEVVAMTGDGVNDAPALKAADIGIAMGNKGTDVARESASIVLLDDNFASIVTAIRLGRRIYDNLQKAMSYILAIHIPIIGLTVLPAFNPAMPLLLLPLHIILMELIIDPVCSVAFEFEKDERGIMSRPPRAPNSTFFGRQEFIKSVGQGLLLLIMVLAVYLSSFREGHTEGQARMIAFFALIIGNLFLIFTNLSKTRTIFELVIRGNKEVFIITGVVLGFVAMLTFIPGLRELMSFELPKYFHFSTTIAGSLIIMALMELMKLWKGRSV